MIGATPKPMSEWTAIMHVRRAQALLEMEPREGVLADPARRLEYHLMIAHALERLASVADERESDTAAVCQAADSFISRQESGATADTLLLASAVRTWRLTRTHPERTEP